ncbi:MAG: hypothetical protein WC969_05970 [Elusimicrobiota bacterium]
MTSAAPVRLAAPVLPAPEAVPAARLVFHPTPDAFAKALAGLILAALSVYFLRVGRRDNDAGRLFWAAVCGLATLGVFLF